MKKLYIKNGKVRLEFEQWMESNHDLRDEWTEAMKLDDSTVCIVYVKPKKAKRKGKRCTGRN